MEENKMRYLVTTIVHGVRSKRPFTADLFTLQQLLIKTNPDKGVIYEVEKFRLED